MSELKDLMLAAPKRSLAVAESLTCGHLQARIGSESGASGFFAGGVTAYTLEQKVTLLAVDRAVAEAVDCVSDQVARQMAFGVCASSSGPTWVRRRPATRRLIPQKAWRRRLPAGLWRGRTELTAGSTGRAALSDQGSTARIFS